jgi:hypothetical protein
MATSPGVKTGVVLASGLSYSLTSISETFSDSKCSISESTLVYVLHCLLLMYLAIRVFQPVVLAQTYTSPRGEVFTRCIVRDRQYTDQIT